MNREIARNRPTPPQNAGEALVDIGRNVRWQIRRGAGVDEVSRRLHSTPACCQLALDFLNASDVLKLRAMVEDWTPERIAVEVTRSKRAVACR